MEEGNQVHVQETAWRLEISGLSNAEVTEGATLVLTLLGMAPSTQLDAHSPSGHFWRSRGKCFVLLLQ